MDKRVRLPVYRNYSETDLIGWLDVSATDAELASCALVPGFILRRHAEPGREAEVEVKSFGLIERTHVDVTPDARLGEPFELLGKWTAGQVYTSGDRVFVRWVERGAS